MLRQKSLELIDRYKNYEHYYTDGSVCGNKTGIGVFHKNYSACLRLPNETSIYTAEAFAILHALRHGLKAKKDFTIFGNAENCIHRY